MPDEPFGLRQRGWPSAQWDWPQPLTVASDLSRGLSDLTEEWRPLHCAAQALRAVWVVAVQSGARDPFLEAAPDPRGSRGTGGKRNPSYLFQACVACKDPLFSCPLIFPNQPAHTCGLVSL